MVFARFCKNVKKTSSRISTGASYQKCVSCGAFIDFQHVWEELLFSFFCWPDSVTSVPPVIQHNSFFNSPLQVVQRRLFLARVPSSFHRLWPELCLYMKALILFSKRWSTRRSNFPRVRKLETTIFWESSKSHPTAELRSINRKVISAPPHPHPIHMWRSIFITCCVPCPLRLLRRAVSCVASTGIYQCHTPPHPHPTHMWRSIFITCCVPCPLRLLRRAVSCVASTGTLSVPHPTPSPPNPHVA